MMLMIKKYHRNINNKTIKYSKNMSLIRKYKISNIVLLNLKEKDVYIT